MQLRLDCQLTAEQYVEQRFWEKATLPPCPAHPEGGCGFCRHSPYERTHPPGAFVARGYCRQGHLTVSLLPDCLASRLPSTLAAVEEDVARVEDAGSSLAAAEQMYQTADDVDQVQGAERRLRRRHRGVRAALVAMAGLMPLLLAGRPPTLAGWREALGIEDGLLVALREKAAPHLPGLPPPLGFGPRPLPRNKAARELQQDSGADPPDEVP